MEETTATITSCNGSAGPCCDGSQAECVEGEWACSGGGTMCTGTLPECGGGGDESPACTCSGAWQCELNNSPIIIDTQGTGFQLTNAANGVKFDLDPTRGPQQLAWTQGTSRNGWLALPHDGKVDTGKDLFGNFTPQPPSDHPNGFIALAVYDRPEYGGNDDGIIDRQDAVWSKLRVWIDENHDGIAQPNELYTLPSVGVYSISLKYVETPFTDKWGNRFRYKGIINVAGDPSGDHIDRTIYDVFLETASRYDWRGLWTLKGEGANTLPGERILK